MLVIALIFVNLISFGQNTYKGFEYDCGKHHADTIGKIIRNTLPNKQYKQYQKKGKFILMITVNPVKGKVEYLKVDSYKELSSYQIIVIFSLINKTKFRTCHTVGLMMDKSIAEQKNYFSHHGGQSCLLPLPKNN